LKGLYSTPRVGHFFTTHLFFTRAGLNLPYIFVKLAFDEPYPELARKLNPLPVDLAWVRGMDFLPVLTDVAAIEGSAAELAERRGGCRDRKRDRQRGGASGPSMGRSAPAVGRGRVLSQCGW
jgi:hypothetical protein